ncbi:MAG: amidohydrolase [Alphaproteobacteria bacterium]|jgi:hippurate hydrolase|nr:amidohydrolase [Alphaproteobacteria bacterium]
MTKPVSDQESARWGALIEEMVMFRRDLHRHPELSWKETETAQRIRDGLDRLGIAWQACAETGTVARLAPHAAGRHIALRGDIDALPIHEESGRDWSSGHSGCMHACGHDGHTAALMSAAGWLKHHEDALPGPVTLLFQPAEEGGHGARRMIEDGALDGVEAVFGWHNWPAIPFGQAVCPDGAVMAGNGTFRITVNGAGGHASQPEKARDPVLAAAAITLALQQVVARRLAPQHAAVLSVTSIDARSYDTVIRDDAVIGGSIRITEAKDREQINTLIDEIAASTARAYGVEAHTEIFPRYDATVNHAGPAGEMRTALAAELGTGWREESLPTPIMASEDFSYYLQQVPGAFALIGSNDGEMQHGVPCHSPRYDFNDRLIPVVTRLFARLAGAPLPNDAAPAAD